MTLATIWKAGDTGHVEEHNRIGRMLSTVVNVWEAGANSNGARSESQIINSLIQSIPNVVLYFPNHWYRLDDPLVIDKNFVTLRGDHRAASILFTQASGGSLVYVTVDSVNLQMSGLCLHTDAVGAAGLRSVGSGNLISSIVEDCWFSGIPGNPQNIGIDAFLHETVIHNCVFEYSPVGINMQRGSAIVNMSNCQFYRVTSDIVADATTLQTVSFSNVVSYTSAADYRKR